MGFTHPGRPIPKRTLISTLLYDKDGNLSDEVIVENFVEFHDPDFYSTDSEKMEQIRRINDAKSYLGISPQYKILNIYETDDTFLTILGLKGKTQDVSPRYLKKV